MLDNLHALIVQEHDFLEGLGAIATTFALFIPLPLFLISTYRQRKVEARERAFALVEKLDTGDARQLRNRILQIKTRYDWTNPDIHGIINEDGSYDLREFFNMQELIGLHLNTSRVDRHIFNSFWRTAYIRDWDVFRPYVGQLRRRFGSQLFIDWERAVEKMNRTKFSLWD